jgi:NADP-dependent 3-hydroxy acid dehydrogenase YdfG
MGNKLVVVTGASSGIGLAVATAFAREGNPLLMIARRMQPIADLAGAEIAYAEADVADYERSSAP